MHEDSPPPFIVIRTPAPPRLDVYDRTMQLVELVQTVLDVATARMHLKDRLDRTVTSLVFEVSRAKQGTRMTRWRHYRRAHELASDCATIFDILVHQNAAPIEQLDRTRTLVRELLAELSSLG